MNNNFDIQSSVSKVWKMSLFNFLSGFGFIVLLIIYIIILLAVASSSGSSPTQGNTLSGVAIGGSSILLILGLILLFINFIVSILLIVESSKINSSGYTNKYPELGSLLVLSIIGLFISGTIMAIIIFVTTGKVLKKIAQDKQNGTLNINYQQTFNNNPTNNQPKKEVVKEKPQKDKIAKIEQAMDLKKRGLIDDDEYKKLKEKIIASDD